jgi:hypothetical protein
MAMMFPRRVGAFVAAAWLVLMAASGARAATRAEQESLLQKSLASPSDYETAFAYVRVSEELKDYEAAIGALEQLLFYNPNLTRVKYELGALYFEAHSYQLAIHYFKDVLASPDIDAAMRARIAAALPEAEKQASPVRSWVFAQAGLRYQSNAAAMPASGQVLSFGTLQPFDSTLPHGRTGMPSRCCSSPTMRISAASPTTALRRTSPDTIRERSGSADSTSACSPATSARAWTSRRRNGPA